MEELIKNIMGEYGWMFISGFLLFFFKGFIENSYYGLRFLLGSDYNVDDIVYINDKKCRIARQSMFKTTFYIIDENKKFHIQNNRLQFMKIEKDLNNDNK